MILKKHKKLRIFLTIILFIYIFFKSLSIYRDCYVPKEYQELLITPIDLNESSDIVFLDTGKLYEKDDSKNINIELYFDKKVRLRDSDARKFEDLIKNSNLEVISHREAAMANLTRNKQIYTKIKYQVLAWLDGDNENKNKLDLGRCDIFKDGTFDLNFAKGSNLFCVKGKFSKAEMKMIDDMYNKSAKSQDS